MGSIIVQSQAAIGLFTNMPSRLEGIIATCSLTKRARNIACTLNAQHRHPQKRTSERNAFRTMWERCTRAHDNATWVDVPSSAIRHLPAFQWMKLQSKDVERRCNTETAVTVKTIRKARRMTTKIT